MISIKNLGHSFVPALLLALSTGLPTTAQIAPRVAPAAEGFRIKPAERPKEAAAERPAERSAEEPAGGSAKTPVAAKVGQADAALTLAGG